MVFKFNKKLISYRFAGHYFRTIGATQTYFRIENYVRDGLQQNIHYTLCLPANRKIEYLHMQIDVFEKCVVDGKYEFVHDDTEIPNELMLAKGKV